MAPAPSNVLWVFLEQIDDACAIKEVKRLKRRYLLETEDQTGGKEGAETKKEDGGSESKGTKKSGSETELKRKKVGRQSS